jgi:hypothetical protein
MDRGQGRESYSNQSYVLSSGVHTSHRSFISSPMMNDLGYEELKKYKYSKHVDLKYKTFLTTRKATSEITFNLLLCFRLLKFKDYRVKLKFSE